MPRPPSRSLLCSLGLHFALVAAIVVVRPHRPASDGTDLIEIEWVGDPAALVAAAGPNLAQDRRLEPSTTPASAESEREPAPPARPTAPSEPPARPAAAAAEPPETAEPEATGPPETPQPPEVTGASETTDPPETASAAETAGPPEPLSPTETAGPPEPLSPTETTDPPETASATETADPPEPASRTETSEPAERAEPQELAEPPNPPPARAARTPARQVEPPAQPAEIPETPPRTPFVETVAIQSSERELLTEEVEDWIRDAARGDRFEPSVVWEHDGHEYTATFTRLPAEGSMDLEEAIVAISTERNGSRFSTQMRLRRLAFSHFAQFVDRWDPDVQIHDDEIGGRFHSNSEIYVSSDGGVKPLFHGKVTTARGVSSPSSSRRIVRRDMFLGGLETRAGRIPLPKPFESLGIGERDDGAAHVFSEDTAITFYADGSYGFRPVESGGAEQRRDLPAEPVLIAGAEDVGLHVEGVVNGRVLVYAPDEIVIAGDLVYAADPRRFPDSDDYLGLVSDGDVEVAPPDVTGPGDLEIDAAIYAKRRFVVDRYRHRERATLSVYGSLTAGSLSATEPRYRTRLEFDPRLEEVRPPRFPMTGRFEVATWNGEWTVEPSAEPTLAIE